MIATEQSQILIVDDEADMCWALDRLLRRDGFAVTTTSHGMESLALCVRERYAVVFVDAKLPDLNGLELIDRLRQQAPTTHIVLISGFFDRDDAVIVEGLERGRFDGFMVKPLDLRQVREMARSLCNESPSL